MGSWETINALWAIRHDLPVILASSYRFRTNPYWQVIDYPGSLMDEIWDYAGRSGSAYRSIFDARIALTLLHHNVREFATANIKDFKNFPFTKVWDPTV